MPGWSTYSYLFGPLVALLGLGLMVLLLRWAFSGRSGSLVAARPERGGADDYGLMVPITTAADFATAEIQRRSLLDAGIQANLVPTLDGPRLMVWRDQVDRALDVLGR